MKLIVGLGNIGKEFEGTNHNAGFMVVDRLAEHFGASFNKRGCDSDYAEISTSSGKVILAKPRTYMNESGRAVKSLSAKFGINLSDVLVIVDDIDQEAGHIRLRKSGSAGTHNGLRSIVSQMQSTEFARLRVGIGKPHENQDLADFVLSKMKMSEAQRQGLDKAFEVALEYTGGQSLDALMSKFNGNQDKNGKH